MKKNTHKKSNTKKSMAKATKKKTNKKNNRKKSTIIHSSNNDFARKQSQPSLVAKTKSDTVESQKIIEVKAKTSTVNIEKTSAKSSLIPSQSKIANTHAVKAVDLTKKTKPKTDATVGSIEQKQSVATVKTTSSLSAGRKAFYYYISIFLCMLFIETPRFALYFEDESANYPSLIHVSEVFELIDEKTNISLFMNKIKDFTDVLTVEQSIEANEPLEEQLISAFSYYYDIFDSYLQEISEKNKLAAEKTIETEQNVDNDTSQKQIAEKKVEIKPEQDIKIDSQEKLSFFKQTAKYIKENKGSVVNSESQGLTANIEQPQIKISLPKLNLNLLIEKKYAYFNAKNIISAPTDLAIEEYDTNLPDFGKKIKVLLVGDSMMQGLVPLIQTALKNHKYIEVVHKAKVSTGLTNETFFHWPNNLKQLLKEHNPNVTIVFIGANDTMSLKVKKKWISIDTESWKKVYSMRALKFLEIATANNRKVVWIGLPLMKKEPYAKRIKVINDVYENVNSLYSNAAYVDTEMLLTDNGKYISFMTGKNNKTIRLRAKDDIHLTFAGGRIITNHMIPTLTEKVHAIRLDEVQGNPIIPLSGKANKITFTSNILNENVEYVSFLPEQLTTNQLAQMNIQAKGESNINNLISKVVFEPKSDEIRSQLQLPSTLPRRQTYQANNVPAGIVAIQDNEQIPSSVSQIIEQSLQVLPISEQDIKRDAKLNSSDKNYNKQNLKYSGEKFPVLYLLHSDVGSAHDFNIHMGKELQKIANEKRIIIIAPSTKKYNWYVNSPIIKKSQMESFILKELIPHVDMLFPTNDKRAIAGLSMGGHGAMLLGLKHPKTFQSIASANGILDIRLHAKSWQISKVLGQYTKNNRNWNNNSVAFLLERKNMKTIPKQMLISVNTQNEQIYEDNKKVHALIQKKKLACDYEETHGSSDWSFWSEQFIKLLHKQADFLQNKKVLTAKDYS